jgi:hypothetical protein
MENLHNISEPTGSNMLEQTELPSLSEINVPSISSAAVLVELKTSCWDGKVTDEDISQQVAHDNNAESQAGTYTKNLFAGNKLLASIKSIIGETRNHIHYRTTMPWIDRGPRLCPQAVYPDYINKVTAKKQMFDKKVHEFLDSYDFYVSEQQAVLGDMFRAHEYPDRSVLQDKFSLEVLTHPVPSGDDFRVDIGTQALQVAKEGYDKFIQETYATGMNRVLGELKDYLGKMVDRLGETPDGEQAIFRNTLISNVLDATKLVRSCNVIGNTQISALCDRLENELLRVTPEALRDSPYLRAQTKSMTQNVIDNLPSLEI